MMHSLSTVLLYQFMLNVLFIDLYTCSNWTNPVWFYVCHLLAGMLNKLFNLLNSVPYMIDWYCFQNYLRLFNN